MPANAGHDVHIINDPNFDFAKDPSVGVVTPQWTVPLGGPPAQAESYQRWQRDIWQRWGFGESQGNPYPDARFPTDYFEEFAANYPFVGSSTSQTLFSSAIESLIVQLNTTVILAPHSAGGPPAIEAAKNQPSLVSGFVFLEPTGPPDESDFPALAGMHMFAPYADRIESRRQTGRKEGVEAAATLFAENGGMAEVISLPDDLGIYGNSHLFMQDNNNEFVAELIINAVNAWDSGIDSIVPTNVPIEMPVVVGETDMPSVAPNVMMPSDMPSIITNEVPSDVSIDGSSNVPSEKDVPTIDLPSYTPSDMMPSDMLSAVPTITNVSSTTPVPFAGTQEGSSALSLLYASLWIVNALLCVAVV